MYIHMYPKRKESQTKKLKKMKFQQMDSSLPSLTAKTATLSIKSQALPTPNFIHYTSLGSIPHLTPDLLKTVIQNNNEPMCLSIAMESFVNLVSDVFTKRDGRKNSVIPLGFPERFSSIHSYLAQPEDCILFADLRDLYQWIHIHPNLKNSDHFISTSTLSDGVCKMTPQLYAQCINELKPDLAMSMADTINPTEGNIVKRLKKSVDRSLDFLDILISSSSSDSPTCTPIIAPLLGGSSKELREYASREVSKRENVDGYLIPIPIQPSDNTSLNFKELIISSISHLPNDKVKIVYGCRSFTQILDAISLGVDLVDNLLAQVYTERDEALLVNFEAPDSTKPLSMKLKSEEYKQDLSPIDASCSCFACQNHSRAYIHHLIITHEMLSRMLLMIHNLTVLNKFIKSIRCSIQYGTFGSFYKDFKTIYESIDDSL